jgi:hypothetical protein
MPGVRAPVSVTDAVDSCPVEITGRMYLKIAAVEMCAFIDHVCSLKKLGTRFPEPVSYFG